MDTFPAEIANIGALGIIAVFAIREVFGYLKTRKTENIYTTKELCNEKHNTISIALGIIQKQSESQNNHLHTIEKDMTEMKVRFESELAGINSSLKLLVKNYLDENKRA